MSGRTEGQASRQAGRERERERQTGRFHGMDMDNFITKRPPPQTVTGMIRDIRLLNTLRTDDADLRFYITTVQDG